VTVGQALVFPHTCPTLIYDYVPVAEFCVCFMVDNYQVAMVHRYPADIVAAYVVS